jgi:hypothetical protein
LPNSLRDQSELGHVCREDPLGPGAGRLHHHPGERLGGDAVDRFSAWLPARTGRALVLVFGHPVYRPYDLFWWWFSYDAYAPEVFDHGGMIATSGGFVAIVVAIAMSVWRGREKQQCQDLWLSTLGRARRHQAHRPPVRNRRRARQIPEQLSAP